LTDKAIEMAGGKKARDSVWSGRIGRGGGNGDKTWCPAGVDESCHENEVSYPSTEQPRENEEWAHSRADAGLQL